MRDEILTDEDNEEDSDPGRSLHTLSDHKRLRLSSVPRLGGDDSRSPSKSRSRSRSRKSRLENRDKDEKGKIEKDEDALKLTREMIQDFVENGANTVRKHQYFSIPSTENLSRYLLKGMGRDENGVPSQDVWNEDDKKWIGSTQDKIFLHEQAVKHPLLNAIAEEIFGLKKGFDKLAMWEKINIIAILAKKVSLSSISLAEIIKKKGKAVKGISLPAPYITGTDVVNVPTKHLQLLKAEDLVMAPTRWRDFISSSPETGYNRKFILSALQARYTDPLRERKGRAALMQFLFDAEEHLAEIALMLAPPDTDFELPKEVIEMQDTILLRKIERLETLRLFKFSPEMAKIFFRKVREEPPSKEKDLRKIKKEAEKEARRLEEKPGLKNLSVLAHNPSSSRNLPTVSFSPGSPPKDGRLREPPRRSPRDFKLPPRDFNLPPRGRGAPRGGRRNF